MFESLQIILHTLIDLLPISSSTLLEILSISTQQIVLYHMISGISIFLSIYIINPQEILDDLQAFINYGLYICILGIMFFVSKKIIYLQFSEYQSLIINALFGLIMLISLFMNHQTSIKRQDFMISAMIVVLAYSLHISRAGSLITYFLFRGLDVKKSFYLSIKLSCIANMCYILYVILQSIRGNIEYLSYTIQLQSNILSIIFSIVILLFILPKITYYSKQIIILSTFIRILFLMIYLIKVSDFGFMYLNV